MMLRGTRIMGAVHQGHAQSNMIIIVTGTPYLKFKKAYDFDFEMIYNLSVTKSHQLPPVKCLLL